MLPSRSAEEARGQGCAGFFSQSIIKSELGPAPYGLMALAGGAAEYNTASSSSQPIHLLFFSISISTAHDVAPFMFRKCRQTDLQTKRKIYWFSCAGVSLVPPHGEEFYCTTFWNSCAPWCWCTRAPIKVASMQKLTTLHHPRNGIVNYFSAKNVAQPNWNYILLDVQGQQHYHCQCVRGQHCSATCFFNRFVITMPLSSSVDATKCNHGLIV